MLSPKSANFFMKASIMCKTRLPRNFYDQIVITNFKAESIVFLIDNRMIWHIIRMLL